jgi:hypothetical protein
VAKQKAPLSLRLDAETEERLELVAEKTGIKKHTLAQMAVEAAINAIEANGFEIVLPIKFDVTRIPTARDQVLPPTQQVRRNNHRGPRRS